MARAATEQSEGSAKPLITVQCGPPEKSSIVGRVLAEINSSVLQLVNIGNGPAISVDWKVARSKSAAPIVDGFIPFVGPAQTFLTQARTAILKASEEFEISCTYEALSGAKYAAETVTHGKNVLRFNVQRTS